MLSTRFGPTTWGLAAGLLADALLGDPRRFHPVAGFGQAAAALETRLYADRRAAGVAHTAVCVGATVTLGAVVSAVTRRRPAARAAATAAATWAVLGGTSLAREGEAMSSLLEADDLDGARGRLSHLCARDPAGMTGPDLARASVESLAENVSDAVVAPLVWGAVAGVPGLLGYRAVNTLDAMVGYRNDRYRRFGWAAARLDDVVNWVPARVSAGVLALAAAPAGGSVGGALRVAARDASRHPSPNAGHPEAAVAGALGVRLGGTNRYHGRSEQRPVLGAAGRPPTTADLRRTVRLVRIAGVLAGLGTVAAAAVLEARRPDDGRGGRRRVGRGRRS